MNIKLDLFLTFLKLGATTFGGGYAMIANIRDLVIEKKKWLTNEELLEICAIAESTPGPIAINLATFLGYKKGGFLGSLLSTIGVILPSFLIIFIISLFFNDILENTYVQYAFVGIKCAVAYLIIKAGIKLFIKSKKQLYQIIITIITFLLMTIINIFNLNISSIILIIFGAIIGLITSSIIDKNSKTINNGE